MPSAVKAFYEAIGGDYADAVARFSSEARLIRFLRKSPPTTASVLFPPACKQMTPQALSLLSTH